eukprot:2012268-Karenia_brevis.AAC.1
MLMIASGRSASLARFFQSGALKRFVHMPWSGRTIEDLRYAVVNSEHANVFKMAEGLINEVRRTRQLCHINFGYHTDWIRDLMDKPTGESTASLLKSFYASFDAMRGILGLGSFPALHICAW